MEVYNQIRWDRLEELEVDIEFIRRVVKEEYGYELREVSITELRENISRYVDIREEKLLDRIEDSTYKKANLFTIKKFKKNVNIPIIDELTSMLNVYFMEMNSIGDVKELDEQFVITDYKKDDKFAIIKMARKFTTIIQSPNEDDGSIDEFEKEIYDCCKFYIDLEMNLVIMYFNDVKESNMGPSKEITYKKSCFRNFFNGVSSKNLVRFFVNMQLEDYFKIYMEEKRNNNERKSVSIIEATSQDDDIAEKSLIRSVNKDCEHSDKRLDAIEYDIENEGLTISEIETLIDGNTIDIKMTGEITCIDTFLYKEVVIGVCREFFGGYELLQ